MKRHTTNRFLQDVIQACVVLIQFGLHISTNVVRLLFDDIETKPSDDEISDAFKGGVMNYWTGKLDDGTDPFGWYEED
ncbi:MAG: hypothetical protein HOB98_06430 [Gammaproteobacteria bacterium]|jgi:hypothetical protein|nr:hypothetical protein [Gammaproteobacteria bacterium]MBT4616071.1 hypothetical protein [Gammaproteobacteria bacterium]MBT5441664.1 hypothetical protein [Gammaproteobacteria bacterium]MBT6572895.1 hypothetical protein [Gammaproteobacteria bacterium]MBT7531893.1 hypothetical protein [Gammaproteobacteria bacterium]